MAVLSPWGQRTAGRPERGPKGAEHAPTSPLSFQRMPTRALPDQTFAYRRSQEKEGLTRRGPALLAFKALLAGGRETAQEQINVLSNHVRVVPGIDAHTDGIAGAHMLRGKGKGVFWL